MLLRGSYFHAHDALRPTCSKTWPVYYPGLRFSAPDLVRRTAARTDHNKAVFNNQSCLAAAHTQKSHGTAARWAVAQVNLVTKSPQDLRACWAGTALLDSVRS